MRTLSKSKILAFRQCPKRLWLEVYHSDLRKDSLATQATFVTGHQVGDIARQLYDPEGKGILINPQTEGFDASFKRTQELLRSDQPIFEAGFRAEGALAFADIMLPNMQGSQRTWHMIEVKSSTSVKDYQRDDVAVQAFVARTSGVALSAIMLAHIDSSWVYPGNGNYKGLLLENDLTDEAFGREEEVRGWVTEAQQILASNKQAPKMAMGKQCSTPYECGFYAYCQALEPQAHHPIRWLPGPLSNELQTHIEAHSLIELSDVPNELLSEQQQRVKSVTISGEVYFDQKNAAHELAKYKFPVYFLDFEAIQFAVPIWEGTRPYQQIPFQFSVHHLSCNGKLRQQAFLDLSGADPSEKLAKALIDKCGKLGPIFAYSASFEKSRISELAKRFTYLAKPLLALNARMVDLLPVARKNYYHPSQQGSWSIKAVLPALCPDLNYGDLSGVQNGGMAMSAFLEAISPETSPERKGEINRQLLAYCELDTYAMVRIWVAFSGSRLNV